MISTKKRVGVVVQTHWDREWYFSREQFVARLMRVMERVADQLEAGQLEQFLFDGQVAALEDLLAHGEPELCERVLRLVRAGRIALGPWYVMADEFLCSGESLWRNLEIGMADARRHGNCQLVGYLPDSFGHIAQMPQLLRQFGIASAVLWRGIDTPHSEFDWVALDGSTVGSLFLTQGYYQHPFNVDDWRSALERYLQQIEGRALSPNLLLTQGGDHLLPHAELAERMAAFNADQAQYELVQEGLQAHAERVLAATAGRRPQVHGELRDNTQAYVLPDVLSTRRYLKLAHQQAEDRLLGEIEPLYAMLDVPLPARALEQCWRTLLQQQAHDSICGCSADTVHREMVSRFEQLAQRLDGLRHQALVAAGMVSDERAVQPGPFVDDASITLFNPVPQASEDWHTVRLFLAGEAAGDLGVRDLAGHLLNSAVLKVTAGHQFHSPLDDFPDPLNGHHYEVALQCPLAGLETRQLWVNKITATRPEQGLQEIGNPHYRIALNEDGELQIHADGCTQPLWIGSELDAGDSYNFSPPPQPEQRQHRRFTLVSARRCGAVQEMVLAISACLPASLDAQRQGPSADEVDCEGLLRLRLLGDSRCIDAQLDWNNHAQDQRSRLVLPLASTITESWSDGAFAWQRRPVVLADYPATPSRREMPPAVNPSHSAIAAGRVNLAHRAMQEYEIVALGEQQALAVTLVRSVGWLSRRDLVTRGVGAGPDLATPEAQCLGPQRFDFRLNLLDEAGSLALLGQARALRRPVLCLRGHSDRWRTPYQLDHPDLQTSSLRRQGQARELRVWNPGSEALASVPAFGIATFTP
ncbi:hypothetical protein J7U46_05100 [Pelomonas sp. V22]|uniref:glycoside hydrolase family 38 N-terminal domain-containing protein n=1 Tax=Pelomonas sp. V22 TaxID=2822139 RepID=UPI0024A7CAC0|nr:hypothetical protein [Pelomonas sp. V22]MDI4632413.1 hypothetical protein [Pelomonas sp. V22]